MNDENEEHSTDPVMDLAQNVVARVQRDIIGVPLVAADTEDVLTPEEHADATGNTKRLRFQRAVGGASLSGSVFSAAHMGAAALHGWAYHKSSTTEPLRITRAAYLAALEAANSGGEPHEAALSEFTPKLTATPDGKPVPARRKLRR